MLNLACSTDLSSQRASCKASVLSVQAKADALPLHVDVTVDDFERGFSRREETGEEGEGEQERSWTPLHIALA